MNKIILLILCLIAFPTIGQAKIVYEEKQRISSVAVIDRTIYINGNITYGIVNAIYKLDPKKYDLVSLHSTGGGINAAIDIGHYIRNNKLKTEVIKNEICYSACTIIYQAGIGRIAHKTSKFMYHYAKTKSWDEKRKILIYVISLSGTIQYRMALRLFGIKKSLFPLWPDNGDALYLTAEEASRYGVVQLILY